MSFYRDSLGLNEVADFTLADKGIATAINVDGVTGDFVHLDAGGALVELIKYNPSDGDCTAEAINQHGAKHIGFAVDDIEMFYDNLPDSVEPLSAPQPIDIGTSILFFRDPEGNFVEIVEA